MLSWIRKQSGATWVKVLFYTLAVTFFGGFGVLSSRSSCRGEPGDVTGTVLVKVGEDQIMTSDFRKRYADEWSQYLAQLKQKYENQVPEELMDQKQFRNRVMDDMVERAILRQQAKKMGIKVSDEEVRDAVAQTRAFRTQSGTFDRDAYLQALQRRGITEKDFEQQIRDSLAMTKVQMIVMDSVEILDGELEQRYKQDKEKISLEFLALDPGKLAPEAQPSDQDIEEYYKNNQPEFDWAETRQINYIYLGIDLFKDQVKPADKEIKDYYEAAKDRYLKSPEKAQVSDIMLNIPEKAEADKLDELKKKMDEVREKAVAPGADFAALAREYSEDPDTKDNGGAIKESIKRGELEPSLEEAVFSLPIGEISQPIQTERGIFLIKVDKRDEADYESLDEVKDKIRDELVHTQAMDKAHQKALEIKSRLKGSETVDQIAQKENNLKAQTTPWFQKEDRTIPGIKDGSMVAEEAFYLEQGEAGEPVDGLDGVYIMQFKDMQEPHHATLEEAKPIVFDRLIPKARTKQAKQKANEYLEKAKQANSLAGIAQELDATIQKPEPMEKNKIYLPDVGYSDDLLTQTYNMDQDNPWPTEAIEVADKVAILHFLAGEPADMSKFKENKDAFMREVVQKRKSEVFKGWLEAQKKKDVAYQESWKTTR